MIIMTIRRILRPALLLLLMGAGATAQAQQPDITAAPPRLLNVTEVADTLGRRHPAVLREQGIGGSAHVRLFINAKGEPDTVRAVASTGLYRLDRAIDAAAHAARFSTSGSGLPVGWVVVPFALEADPAIGIFEHVPLVVTPEEVAAAALERYPPELRQLQVGANVSVALNVDSAGRVVVPVVVDPSCFFEANDAALNVARSLRFAPSSGGAVAMRRTFASISFIADSAGVVTQGELFREEPSQVADTANVRRGSATRPQLRNRNTVRRALVESYPPHLRDRGIGGSASVWFKVGTDGRVTHRVVSETSGHCELDVAALGVARLMEFDSALVDGVPTEVWVEIPIVFTAR